MSLNAAYFTEERRLIQDGCRAFTAAEILPVANELDPQKKDIPENLRAKLAEMGYFGITIPEEYGGLGLGCFEYCLVAEELARGWMSVASMIARGNSVFGKSVMTDTQRRRYLEGAASGEVLGAFALSEPDTGSDLSAIACRAQRTEAGYVINGNKYWCTFADGADYLLVFARTAPRDDKRPHLGLSAFFVDKPRGELPRGVMGNPIPKIGYFGWKTYELAFENCEVGHDALLGEEGQAFYLMTEGLETARAHTAARSIGLARGALEDALTYAAQRHQFGKPIAEFQAIRFKLATMATQIEAARQLMYHVCTMIDSGRRCDKEAAMVKYFAAEMAERVCSEAMQVLGGAGYTTLYPVERYWRDARLTRIFEGTSEIQQRIISDHLLGKAKS